MNRLHRLLLVTFVESCATILVERGVYFYSKERLGFSGTDNLWLALGIGAFYVVGALLSHRLARRWGERKYLLLLIAGHFACHISLVLFPHIGPFIALNLVLAALTGSKWPIFESYISAGHGARGTADAIGKFNISWALSVPVSMIVAGQLIAWRPSLIFACAAAINLATIALLWPLEEQPIHLPDDHVDRPPADQAARYGVLVVSGRWSMLASYTLLFVLAPLMPTLFGELGFGVRAATAFGGLIEWIRLGVFVLLFINQGWHGKVGIMVWSAISLPVGFFLVLFSPQMPEWIAGQPLATAIAGEIIFGAAAGAAYYAALYYAMAVSASVESGGEHESLVGGGFALGPAAGLIGTALAGVFGGPVVGMLAGIGPVALICFAAALWPMRRLLREDANRGGVSA